MYPAPRFNLISSARITDVSWVSYWWVFYIEYTSSLLNWAETRSIHQITFHLGQIDPQGPWVSKSISIGRRALLIKWIYEFTRWESQSGHKAPLISFAGIHDLLLRLAEVSGSGRRTTPGINGLSPVTATITHLLSSFILIYWLADSMTSTGSGITVWLQILLKGAWRQNLGVVHRLDAVYIHIVRSFLLVTGHLGICLTQLEISDLSIFNPFLIMSSIALENTVCSTLDHNNPSFRLELIRMKRF